MLALRHSGNRDSHVDFCHDEGQHDTSMTFQSLTYPCIVVHSYIPLFTFMVLTLKLCPSAILMAEVVQIDEWTIPWMFTTSTALEGLCMFVRLCCAFAMGRTGSPCRDPFCKPISFPTSAGLSFDLFPWKFNGGRAFLDATIGENNWNLFSQ